MKKLTLDKIILTMLILLFSVATIYFLIQMISLWVHGIGKVANDPEDYYYASFPVAGEYSVEINLGDLESNKGKVLYEENDYEIQVSDVTLLEGDYIVYFRSIGHADMNGAMLVSGIEHAEQDKKAILHAKATTEYIGESFELDSHSYSGIDYKDGDEFSYYLFPPNTEINVEENPTITITVSNLNLNMWLKKDLFKR